MGSVDSRAQKPSEQQQLEATKAKYERMLQETMDQMVQKLKKEEKRQKLADQNKQKAMKSEMIK